MNTIYMLASQSTVQMMSFVVVSDGHVIVIDGGNTCDADYLCSYIKKFGGKVDAWFLTHAHSDHINALSSLLERHSDEVTIDGVYFNFPSDDYLKAAEPDGFVHVEKLYSELAEHKLRTITLHKGDSFKFGALYFKVLLEPDESIKRNEVNNSSVVLRIEASDRSLLILGDLGVEGGDRLLATNPHELIKADYVQMAHHGQQGVGKNVYEAIDPDYCLWPTPDWLWENNAGRGYDTHIWKTIVTRGWMSEQGIKWHYIMKDGTQEIPFGEEKE